jgi:hypothetical protein
MSNIRVNSITDRLGTGSPDFPNGITIDTVTVSGKIVHTGDTDTSIGFPINDTITMDTAGTERMRINSSGNVGIGTTEPLRPLSVAASSAEAHIFAGRTATGGNLGNTAAGGRVSLGSTSAATGVGYEGARIGMIAAQAWTVGSAQGSSLVFENTANGTATLTERMRIDSSGNVGIGTTAPAQMLHLSGTIPDIQYTDTTGNEWRVGNNNGVFRFYDVTAAAERARIDSSGNLLVGKTVAGDSVIGFEGRQTGLMIAVTNQADVGIFNRRGNDGTLVVFEQQDIVEGTISVSGTTVSYNGGHLSRWAQFPDNSRPELLKGTVMSNLDQMSNWDNEDNEQLNCIQVSTVEGDANVAGVFVAWDSTDDGYNDILLAMTGDMVIRIAAGTTVQRGDLLMSAGDGTAKPQGDDIVRSKTIAKVTSTHISHIYDDGSYCVPCVIMAC